MALASSEGALGSVLCRASRLSGLWGGTDLLQNKCGDWTRGPRDDFAFALSAVGWAAVPEPSRRALRELIRKRHPPPGDDLRTCPGEAQVETERESKRHHPGKVLLGLQTIIKMCPLGLVFQQPHLQHPAASLTASPACVHRAVSSPGPGTWVIGSGKVTWEGAGRSPGSAKGD